MFKTLMTSRRFAPLFWCQFFSALNDNFLKNALGMLILFKLGDRSNGASARHAGRRRAHRPVLHPLGPRRRARRPLRQGGGGRAREACRDSRRRRRGARLLPALGADPVRGARPVRRPRRAVRPGQIRHPARATSRRGELPAGNALVEGATFLAILVGTIAGGIAVGAAMVRSRSSPSPLPRLRLSAGFRPAHPSRAIRRPRSRHRPQSRLFDDDAARAS